VPYHEGMRILLRLLAAFAMVLGLGLVSAGAAPGGAELPPAFPLAFLVAGVVALVVSCFVPGCRTRELPRARVVR
jgi:hypothetical protein